MISAIVLTRNEEKNIGKCLKSIRHLADEILVIDDGSNDRTVKMARDLGAKVYQRKLDHDFSQQRNFGLKKARGNWILFIDADENVTSKLRDEIKDKISKSKDVEGLYLKRKDRFLGKWLRFGEIRTVNLVRLGRKEAGWWQRPVHEVWEIKGKIGKLKNPIIHNRQITVSNFLKRINQYSSIRAGELYQQKVKTNAFLILAYPIGKFLQNYFLRLGFLDGIAGLMMAVMMSFHSFSVRAKLYLLYKNRGVKITTP